MKYTFFYCILFLLVNYSQPLRAQKLSADIYIEPYFEPAEYALTEDIITDRPKVKYEGSIVKDFEHYVRHMKCKPIEPVDGVFLGLDYRVVIDLYKNGHKIFRISLDDVGDYKYQGKTWYADEKLNELIEKMGDFKFNHRIYDH